MPSTIGTAPRRPAQPRSARSRVREVAERASRPTPRSAGSASTSSAASTSPGTATSGRSLGEDEQPEHDEHRHLREEGEPLVEGDELAAVAARACCRRRARRGRRRGSRCRRARPRPRTRARRRRRTRPVRTRRSRAAGGRRPRSRQRRARCRRRRPSPSCPNDAGARGPANPKVGLVNPLDQPDRERDRHRVVPAGLGLERPREPPPDVREPERREDRCGVGRGDDGAEQDGFQPGQVEEEVRGCSGQERGHDDADGAEQRGRHDDLAQPPPRGREPALVEDRGEPDDADGARELGVVELDVARAVRAEQHPERQERDE